MDSYSELTLLDQRLVNYRPATDIALACALCTNYVSEACQCVRVAGHVRPDYVCDALEVLDVAVAINPIPVMMSGQYEVVKANDAAQVILGWASIAITKDGEQTLDAHSDYIDSDDLEAAAYDFMANARVSGEDHLGEVDAICVESVVFTKEKAAALGIPEGILPEAGWWVGFHIPDPQAYARARDEKRMFSIEGSAVREVVKDT